MIDELEAHRKAGDVEALVRAVDGLTEELRAGAAARFLEARRATEPFEYDVGLRNRREVARNDGWRVPGTHGTYRVTRQGDRWACTCPWEEEHQGTRGPCKHVLAVVLAQ